jgi:hypothetical protein
MNIHEFMDIHGLSENHKKSQWTSMDLPCIALVSIRFNLIRFLDFIHIEKSGTVKV